MSLDPSRLEIDSCVQLLREGKPIAYPTEGVWGLGCDPADSDAVRSILELKQRPASKGLILIGSREQHFAELLHRLPGSIREKIIASSAQHITWLVPHGGLVSPLIHGDSDKVAIRLSAHPIVVALTEAFGSAIVSTSANPAGRPSALTAQEVVEYFDGAIQCAPGEVGRSAKASTIIDAASGAIIRA
jgi:L-threonylcarbamoyladenylate synthase